MHKLYPYPATGKLYYKIPLQLQSPLIIGSGENGNSDVDVLKDTRMEKEIPIIPATSLIGVFRSFLYRGLEKDFKSDKDLWCNFYNLFGSCRNEEKDYAFKDEDKNSYLVQSAILCQDIELPKHHIVVRDGVAIEAKTSTAKEKSKYDYEIVEGDEIFYLYFEVTLRVCFSKELFEKYIVTILKGINNGDIRVGAKTNKGFGRCNIPSDPEYRYLNFKNNREDVKQWIMFDPKEHTTQGEFYKKFKLNDASVFTMAANTFQIDACFKIKNSIMIKSFSSPLEGPDAVFIRQNGKPVMPGTSVMGALRHRALKILNTVASVKNGSDQQEKINDLFGFVPTDKDSDKLDKNGKTPKPLKGRVIIEEHFIKNPLIKIQTRIKIDRFTGGTIAGALLEEEPLWGNGTEDAIKISITIKNYHKWEPGLFLLLLKDLWTGDLPIGGGKNIGRGVLEGTCAKIYWRRNEPIELNSDGNGGIKDQDALKTLEEEFFSEFVKEFPL